jgi:hypothetical protein
MSANFIRRTALAGPFTVATTGTTEVLLIVPVTGTITSVRFSCKDALAAHASNYATFAATNKGAAAAGTTVLLLADDTNTTKTTTGTAVTGYASRTLPLTATAADLAVNAGDVIVFQVISAATLANTLTECVVALNVKPSS